MTKPPVWGQESAPPGAEVRRLDPFPIPLYRSLYAEVGGPWNWYERLAWSDEQVGDWLARPEVEVHLLTVDGSPAGYFELVSHEDKGREIGYFGLAPSFIGRGLGGWFLRRAVVEAWASGPSRVWLNTCTLDHPSALPNYLRNGFTVFRTDEVPEPPGRPGARRP